MCHIANTHNPPKKADQIAIHIHGILKTCQSNNVGKNLRCHTKMMWVLQFSAHILQQSTSGFIVNPKPIVVLVCFGILWPQRNYLNQTKPKMQASVGVNKIYTQMREFQEIEEEHCAYNYYFIYFPFYSLPPDNLTTIHHFIVYSCMNV